MGVGFDERRSIRSQTNPRPAGKPEGPHAAGGHAVADAPDAVLARTLAALTPAIEARTFFIGLAQLFRRPGFARMRVGLGIIRQAQIKRVHVEGRGEFIHGALERPEAGTLHRRPHGCRHVDVDPLEQLPGADRGRRIERLAALARRFEMRLGHGGRIHDSMRQRCEPALPRRAEADFLFHPGLIADAGKLILAPQVQLHCASRHPRAGGGQNLMRPDIALRAEAAAGMGRDHADVFGPHAQGRGDDRRHVHARLHGIPQCQLSVFELRHRARGFHGVVMTGGLDIGLRDLQIGPGQSGVDVAQVEIIAHEARLGRRLALASATDDRAGGRCAG